MNKLAANSLYLIIYKSANTFFTLLINIYISRILYAEGTGKIFYIQNIVSYFIMFAQLGIPNYGIREVAIHRSDKEILNRTVSELFIINCACTMVSTLAYLIFIKSLIHKDSLLYYMIGSTIALNVFNVDWFFSGMEDYRFITIRSLVIKTISFIFIFIFVKSADDIVKYAFLLSVATAGNYLFNAIYLNKKTEISLKGINLKRHFKPIFYFFVTVISVELYTKLDTTMIGFLNGAKEVGYYSYPVTIVKTLAVLLTSISAVLLPRLSIFYAKKDYVSFVKLIKYVIFILAALAFTASAVLFLNAKFLILLLFGNSYYDSILTLKILSPLVIILCIGNLFGTQILVSLNQEKYLLSTTCCGALTNLIMNYFLIVPYKQNGAAIASVISELTVMLIQIVLAFHFLKKFKIANTFEGVAKSSE